MPIYEYSCKTCGRTVELLQKMGTDKPGVLCPDCGEDALTKVLSVTAPAQMSKTATGGCDAAISRGQCGGCCSGCH